MLGNVALDSQKHISLQAQLYSYLLPQQCQLVTVLSQNDPFEQGSKPTTPPAPLPTLPTLLLLLARSHPTPHPRPALRLKPLHPLSRRLQHPLLPLPHRQRPARMRNELLRS